MNSRKLMCLLGFVAVLLVTGQALGDVIYSDSFSGLSSDNLNGKTTDVGGGVWTANTGLSGHINPWKQDGSIIASATHDNALLPFTPASGYIYTLSAKINNTAGGYGGSMWVGFAPSSGYFGVNDWWGSNPIGFETRDTGTETSQAYAGGLNLVNYSAAAAGSTLAIALDTSGAQWSSTFYINGVQKGSPYVYPADFFTPAWQQIAQVGFGRDNTSQAGTVDDFTLTRSAVPEPSMLVLTGMGLLGLLAYAWRKRK